MCIRDSSNTLDNLETMVMQNFGGKQGALWSIYESTIFGVAYSLESRHSLTTKTMEFAINSASQEVDFYPIVVQNESNRNLNERTRYLEELNISWLVTC